MTATAKIAVAGSTGRVGRHIVDVLHERGHDVMPIARSLGVDVITGEGLAAALAGVETVIDASTGPSPEEAASVEFFSTATRNLQRFGQETGAQRLVVVSIVGIDQSRSGYGVGKLAQERLALEGPLAARVLRATQFHEFVEQLVQWGTQGDVAYVQHMRTQPVAARSVAEALVDLATAAWPDVPNGKTRPVDVAGPREESMVELAKLYGARHGGTLRIEGVRDASDPNQALYDRGAMLPGPDAILAGPTYEEWLAANG
jgi:uncharacterized protein YbjT (DUF2867 family)